MHEAHAAEPGPTGGCGAASRGDAAPLEGSSLAQAMTDFDAVLSTLCLRGGSSIYCGGSPIYL
jgi:hypothetical protein